MPSVSASPPPRERFAKVAQPCCNNTVPVVRPFAVGTARRPVKHVSRRGPDEGETKTKWRGLCGPKSVIENQKRAEAWELIWRSPDDGTRSCSPRGCTEHHQTGTHSTQSSSAPQGHRAGRPSTADEQRAKNSESTRAAPQESGGQIRLGDEIDICMRQIWQNRWPCEVLERKTRSSNEPVGSFVSEAASS